MDVPTKEAPNLSNNAIRAAGGLVWRDPENGKEILIVHRQRYRDWTLPKGKCDPGESIQETARREVKEETGYEVRIIGFAGAIGYEVEGKPKVVSFWHMEATGVPSQQIDSEVVEAVWLPVDQAYQRLQYPIEKALLEALWAECQEQL